MVIPGTYKVWDIDNNKVVTTWHIHFDEKVYYKDLGVEGSSMNLHELIFIDKMDRYTTNVMTMSENTMWLTDDLTYEEVTGHLDECK